MSDYRRLYIPGGTYFFTLVSYQRKPIFTDGERVEQLRRSFREVKRKRPFDLLAAVVLPDHLYCLWRLPETPALPIAGRAYSGLRDNVSRRLHEKVM